MQTELGTATLSTGESLRLLRIEAPDATWAGPVATLLGHKPPVYLGHVIDALDHPLDAVQTLFYLGLVGEVPVSIVMVVGAHGAGILGHVFTVPEWRQRGASKAVFAVLEPDVRALGYRVLTLGTNPEGHARRIYEAMGFAQVTPGNGSMIWGDGALPAGGLSCGPARWDDWGWMSVAGCAPVAPGEDLPRSRLLGPGSSPGHVENTFIRARAEARPLHVLRQGPAAVGWAEISARGAAALGAAALDFYVRPGWTGGAGLLLAGLAWPDAPVICAQAGQGGYKVAALAASGFAPAGDLPGLGQLTVWLRRPL